MLTTSTEGFGFRGSCFELSEMRQAFAHEVLLCGYEKFFKKRKNGCTLKFAPRTESYITCKDICCVETFKPGKWDDTAPVYHIGTVKALKDALMILAWNGFCLLYSDTYGSNMEEIFSLTAQQRDRIITRRLPTNSDERIKSSLNECVLALRNTYKTFVLVAEQNMANKVIHEARRLNKDFQGFLIMSKWFVITDEDNERLFKDTLPPRIQNLAYLQRRTSSSENSFRLSSLTWSGNVPEMRNVSTWNSNSSMNISGVVFPEAAYVLNGAHYTVTTKVMNLRSFDAGDTTMSMNILYLLMELALTSRHLVDQLSGMTGQRVPLLSDTQRKPK